VKTNRSGKESICWRCENARAHLCPWASRGEKVWNKAIKEKRKEKGVYYTVYIVEKCLYFAESKKVAIG